MSHDKTLKNLSSVASPRYLIIGSGRLAKHLVNYLNQLHLNYSEWDRSQDPHLLRGKIESSTHILLAISDSAIESFFTKHLDGLDKTVVHFSGALSFADIHGAHPLMTFGSDLYDLSFYQKIHFAFESNQTWNQVLPGWPNSYSKIQADQKAKYHAACVLGGNFTTLLIAKMLQEFSDLHIPPASAELYIEKIINNVFASPQTALTGPLARKDFKTINKNLSALEGDKYQKIYQAFVDVHCPEFSNERSL